MFLQLKIYRKIKARKFAEALLLFPANEKMTGTLLIYRAHIFSKTHQYDKAKQDLDTIKKTGKDLYYAFNNQGYIYLEQHLFDEAIAELLEARRLKPDHSFAADNLGFAYMMTNKLEEGVKLVEESFRLDRHNYYAIRNMGVYYLLRKEYADALVVLTKAKGKDKTIDDIDHYLAICQFRLGNTTYFTEAREKFSGQEKVRLDDLLQRFL